MQWTALWFLLHYVFLIADSFEFDVDAIHNDLI